MKKSRGFVLVSLGLAFIASLGFASAAFNIADILNQWADMGVFYYLLPFLLIFALVYGILSSTEILGRDQKAVNAIVSLALGLLALVTDAVPKFFMTLAPNLGIALSILLAAIVLVGLFIRETNWIKTGLIIVAIIAFVAVVISSFSGYPTSARNLWDEYGPALVTLAILAGIIALIVWGGRSSGSSGGSH